MEKPFSFGFYFFQPHIHLINTGTPQKQKSFVFLLGGEGDEIL